jgi:DNA polymerase-3 subunit delta'
MAWQGIEGHDDVAERFRRLLRLGRLASTFLFVGPSGIGKRAFAEKLAQALLCTERAAEQLAPCDKCSSCLQVAARTHPDLYIVEKPPDKSSIPLSLLVGDDAHRMREGLCHDIALKPFMGGHKVAIIDDADSLGDEGANCLLKTLEEPPPRSVLILIGTSADTQLPTIRSRAQLVRFRPLSQQSVADILESRGLVTDRPQAERLAEFSEGSVQKAMDLADDQLWEFRRRLLDALASPRLESVTLAGELVPFVEAAGKDAAPRRARARQVIGFAIAFYRQLLRVLVGSTPVADAELLREVERARSKWPSDPEIAGACIDRSLEALAQVDRNAHQTTLLECWLDDLSRIIESGLPTASGRA